MANNIFRMQGDDPQHDTGLSNHISNWAVSKQYDKNCIDIISDDDTTSTESPTSIPSPFARIALAKTAFSEVANGNTNNAYRQIVSDCLDLAEICFDFPKWEQHIEIIEWNKIDDLKSLPATNPLKSTLDLFLKSDSDEFHFDKMDTISVLTLKTGEAIGATSPCTVFFSPENNYNEIKNAPEFLLSGGHKAFQRIDSNYTGTPLSSRDWDFVKYFWHFCHSAPIDQCVLDYLVIQKKDFDTTKAIEINNIEKKLSIADYDTNRVIKEILKGFPYCSRNTKADIESDFMLESDEIIVIPNGGEIFITSQTTYKLTQHQLWDENRFGNKYCDDKELDYNKRILPTHDNFPCLYISDFLTNTIVRMPYKLNSQSFFNGYYDESDEESFLLPLTDTFFKFFTVEDLQKNVVGSKKRMFEFVKDLNGIKVILRIPIKNNNFIEYSRMYVEIGQDLSKNIGSLIEKRLGLGIMPFVKFPDSVTAKEYRVALFDKGDYDVQLVPYNDSSPIDVNDKEKVKHVVRRTKQSGLCSIESYRIDDNFNRISIRVGDVSGVLIPKFDEVSGSKHFTFAVDFGTTNTHIEYNESAAGSPNSVSNPFDITNSDKQLHRLHEDYRVAVDNDIDAAFKHNFIPSTIGDNDYSFPTRTALAEKEGINYTANPVSIADGNIPFPYEKDPIPDYNTIKTELKWDTLEVVKLYLENVFILLRNKVVANRGDLIQTKVIWSYPASMNTARYNEFQAYWEELFEKYFGNKDANGEVTNIDNMKAISESTAPYFYYSSSRGATTETVTIDVGGGTTDVYVLENSNPKMLMSFRFASNVVFGDGFGYDSDNNGFVKQYYSEFLNVMKTNNLDELSNALTQIAGWKRSPDIIAFLFSLINNKNVDGNNALNFLQKLGQNGKMKYTFILFYGAILYYVAKTMKAKNVKRPLKLGFSGNGARTLRILSSRNDTIGHFAQLIFNGVYNETTNNQLEIILEPDPKTATSKGSIKYCLSSGAISQTPRVISSIKFTVLGNNLTDTNLITKTYQEVIDDEQIKNDIVQSVADYIEFIFDESQKNDNFFVNDLGADENIVWAVKDFCSNKTKLMQSLSASLNKVDNKPQPVEETLFFYPLIGVLHDLALKISNNEL
ncbi:hypothetical protein FACS1894199_01310 [Bacteroidia bacterium]|nr:hypothetical protein FACS1894199_01310 [Bacteroidia bacterium]